MQDYYKDGVLVKWNDALFNDTANPCLGHIVSY